MRIFGTPALLALLVAGCAGPTMDDEPGQVGEIGDVGDGACEYPQGAAEPMEVGKVLTPYAWSNALHADGRSVELNLGDAPCGAQSDIEWSPHDVLLFVSVPAW